MVLAQKSFNLLAEQNNDILENYSNSSSNEKEFNYSKIFNLLTSGTKKF